MRSRLVIDSIAALALAASGAVADAGNETRHLRFEWATPTPGATCALVETSAVQRTVRHAGSVERQDMGHVCLVQMPRRRFDATYKACVIDYTDSEPREHYACWLTYTPREVTFLYSYSDEPLDAPPCAFACSLK
jgi:hypothetical protein